MVTPQLLYALSHDELVAASRNGQWPKWQSMALLRSLCLPVLNACLIPPGHDTAFVQAATHALSAAARTENLMIRSDGGAERKRYYRGGNTFSVEEIPHRAAGLLAEGRAVILIEPTNRFTNRLTVVVRMDRPCPGHPGSLTLEALGPGYDVADLTRGLLPPQVTASLYDVDWVRYQAPRWNEWEITCCGCSGGEAGRRHRRLIRLAQQTLIDASQLSGQAGPEQAEAWLREQGFLHLFGPQHTREALAGRLRQLFDDAFSLARAQPNRAWRCLATAFSVFNERRVAYWDLVDGERKFGAAIPLAQLKERDI
ncbi:hypothetical protein ACWEPN_27920 [Nonomuraea wenchangensis]